MKRKSGIWSAEEFQEDLEEQVRKGFLPQPAKTQWSAKLTYDAYLSVGNKQAKIALLNQLAGILAALRLRNLTVRFEKIISEIGIEKSFAYELLVAYTNPKERWEVKNG